MGTAGWEALVRESPVTIAAEILTALGCLACLVWASRHYMISVERRRGFTLTGACAGPPPQSPLLSVVVAAKDEEACIETCVRSLLAQDYPRFEVIVCDDRSGDRTAEIVRDVAREDGRVRLVHIDRLPEGWCGKNHAMQNGIAQARGQWICMIDADCRQESPRTLSVAMQYALDHQVDLLSVLPRLEMDGFWENVVQPVCSGLMMIWFHPDKVNDPRKPNAYANGAFMLMHQDTYRAIGTHEAVRMCLNEDMHMARLAKQKGLKLRVVRGGGLYCVRMYTSARQILRGWSRIFLGTFGTFRRMAALLLILALTSLMPYVEAVAGWALADSSSVAGRWFLACGIAGTLATALQLTAIYRFYRLIGAQSSLAWCYPLGCAMAMIALVMSLSRLRTGTVVTWRGTTYVRA